MADTRGKLPAATICEVTEDGKPKRGGVSVKCMFNPYEYSVSKSNSYSESPKNNADVPHVEFQKAGAQTLKLALYFDTFESEEDVSLITNQLWKLMETKTRREGSRTKKVPPPEVAFEWGVFSFVAFITNMTQKFTVFKRDGTPVRAQVDVTFTQYNDRNDYPGQNPTSGADTSERVWRVIAGDRLDTIAAEVYSDASKWRAIAAYNHIVNPLALRPGQRLAIPLD